MRKNWLIDRRTCLKGLGVALGLPLLETMGWADPPRGGAAKPPVRLAFMYQCNGVHLPDFFPKDAAVFPTVLSDNLEPLRAVIDYCLVLGGNTGAGHGAVGNAAHAIELSSWLTGQLLNTDNRANIDIAPSIDQIAAQHLGPYTALPSLELGFRDNAASGTGQDGVNNRYYTTGNYRTATQPLPVETSPANVYKRLFSSRQSRPLKRGGPAVDASKIAAGAVAAVDDGDSLDRSMLDKVLESAKDLRAQISVGDQRQLDDYLETVHSLQARIVAIERQQAEAARAKADKGASATAYKRSEPITITIPLGEDHRDADHWADHTRMMGDLMVLAFQTDTTRVCTLIPSHPVGMNFTNLGLKSDHHGFSHHENRAEKIAGYNQCARYYLTQFAYILGRMKGLREGAGNLLDNVIMMYGSGLGDGFSHTNTDLPTILAGRGGGTVRTGRYVPKISGNHGDLLTAILARVGVPLKKPIGIGTRILPDLA
jgi:hypothetical protein